MPRDSILIRVRKETVTLLKNFKGDKETYDDVIVRIWNDRNEAVGSLRKIVVTATSANISKQEPKKDPIPPTV